jgi:hypothetical protein
MDIYFMQLLYEKYVQIVENYGLYQKKLNIRPGNCQKSRNWKTV